MKVICRLFLICLSVFLIQGCGFFNTSETLEIADITVENLENGNKQVTINYVDEFTDPLVFIVPKGDKGDTGNGIGEVTYKPVEGGTEITINFTAEGTKPLIFTVNNGVSVTKIKSNYVAEEETTYIQFLLSDGSASEVFKLPKGEKGEDGVSIIEIKDTTNRDKSVTLDIFLSDGSSESFTIPAPIQGEDGNGVKEVKIEPLDDFGNVYQMILKLDDDTEISTPIKRVNKWFTDSANPDPSIGIKGDLYYCTTNKTIYVKESSGWTPSIDLDKISNIAYEVKFHLNAPEDDDTASMPSGVNETYYITHGKYFSSNEDGDPIPVPTSDLYEFAGWYTEKGDKLNLNIHGQFTDLTVIADNLDLYARWVKKA